MSEVFVENVEKIRELTIQLAKDIPIVKHPNMTAICHPFLTSYIDAEIVGNKSVLTDLSIRKNRREWLRKKEKEFKKYSVDMLFYLVNNPYKFTWLEMCKPYLSPDAFAEYFADAWTLVEFPNRDPVSVQTQLAWFKESPKELLMDDEELEALNNLPPVISVYRGVSGSGTELGLSWTMSKETALWFQHRMEPIDPNGRVYHAEVPREAVLACFNGRDEQEIVLDVFAIQDKIQVEPAA